METVLAGWVSVGGSVLVCVTVGVEVWSLRECVGNTELVVVVDGVAVTGGVDVGVRGGFLPVRVCSWECEWWAVCVAVPGWDWVTMLDGDSDSVRAVNVIDWDEV